MRPSISSSAASTKVGAAVGAANAAPPARSRRRAPTPADLLLLVLLLAAVAALQAGVARGGVSQDLLLRTAGGPDQWVDARRDADYNLTGPLGTTVVTVRDGDAWIARAPCRNQVCVRMGHLHGTRRALVCLPNRILVRFASKGQAEGPDAIAH